ncbi:uncharacterized protein [Antedon mediterranea]|uniref:uncharacterized protein n=1 Tax=Antedon mediterranea TaxID=105859 RepID=UPI003AF94032
MNPADALTKPIHPEGLHNWNKGPAFICEPEEKWPRQEPSYDTTHKHVFVKEYTQEALRSVNQVSAVVVQESFERHLLKGTSDWFQLKSIVARCRRFLQWKTPKLSTNQELQEDSLFFLSQRVWEDEELNSRTIKKLNPKFDQRGIIRVEGRLRKLTIQEGQKQPVLLRRGSLITDTFARHIHFAVNHQGYRVAIAYAFKKGVYIAGGTKLFKDVAAKCIFCRTRRRVLLTQQMGELPSFRCQPHILPFLHVAMDFFGHVNVKLTRNTVVEGSILIVTCMTTRAISLELVESLTTESFLCAFRRFTCNRGIHPHIQ